MSTQTLFAAHIPANEYHQATKDKQYLSSHRLNRFRQCPELYRRYADGIIPEGDSSSFLVGRAAHSLILEGRDAFAREFVVANGPTNPKTGKPYGEQTRAYAEWAATLDKSPVTAANFELIEKMSDAVGASRAARELLSHGEAELTFRAEWNGCPCQARADWADDGRNLLVDLKTCQNLDKFKFEARDFGYKFQLAFYAEVIRLAASAVGREIHTPDCYIIAVEKIEPYRVGVFHLLEGTVYDANHTDSERDGLCNDSAIAALLECRRTNVWPTGWEEVVDI